MNFINQLKNKYNNIVLASSSIRRQQLLTSIGLQFEIIIPDIDEKSFCSYTSPQNYSQFLSIAKINNVYQKILKSNKIGTHIIIAADTIVVIENEIINKPRDKNEAIIFLTKLNNKKHQVFTGISVLNSINNKLQCRYAKTDVYFRKLNEQEIIDYVNTQNPLDKAGGYGIQDDYGCLFVKKIEGCYNNVVGLSLELLYEMLLNHLN